MGRQQRLRRQRREDKRIRERMAAARAKDGAERGCLFCRTGDGGFKTQEHVLPESMGNTQLVLPNGVVCDRCNNGVLSDLDQSLCDFFPLKMRRTMLGIRSKAGKVPVTRFTTGNVESPRDAHLIVNVHNENDKTTFREVERFSDGRVRLEMKMKGGSRMTPRYCAVISRSLLKGALECAWIDHGEAVLEPRFDHVRAAVLGEPRDGFLMVARRGEPDHNGTELTYGLTPDPGGQTQMAVFARYYGVVLATNSLLAEPAIAPAVEEHALVVRFKTSDFRRPRSVS